jgi:hypothetical protein
MLTRGKVRLPLNVGKLRPATWRELAASECAVRTAPCPYERGADRAVK